jgi:hypothetical protein
MKEVRRKRPGLRRYISAVRDLLETELGELSSVPEDVQENQQLLYDIKEMLENAFEYFLSRNILAALHALEDPGLSSDDQLAFESIKAAWGTAPELQNLLNSASPIVQDLFIAQLRALLACSKSRTEWHSG